MWKILLVDDQCLPRTGLAQILQGEPDLDVCGQTASGVEALSLAETLGPDLVVLELNLPDLRGLELIRRLRALRSGLYSLVFSYRDEMACAERALLSGARGYVMKREPPDVLLHAVRHVLRGGIYVSEAVNTHLLLELTHDHPQAPPFPSEVLSHRELEVFELTGRGLSNHEIADRMRLAPKTVESYRLRIKSKLQLHNTAELMHRAVKWIEDELC